MSICSAVMPSIGAGHLEVHVTEVILVAEDVGKNGELLAFLDETHGDTGHRRLGRHAGVHQRQARSADRRHRARTIRLGNLGNHAHHVGKLVDCRHDRLHATAGELAMTDFATLRRAHKAGLTDTVWREVVMQHERLFAFALDRVDDLGIASGA